MQQNDAAYTVQAANEEAHHAMVTAGTKLTNSKAMKGGARGIYHDIYGIKGHL